MSTRSYITIHATIDGDISFDYADHVREPDMAKRELQLLCTKYGLELDWEELY